MGSDAENHREVVSLRDYVDRQLVDLVKRLEDQRTFTEKAVDKAELALGKRLDSMNEFRESLKDQASRMATREQLDAFRERLAEIEKRSAVSSAVIGIVVSIIVSVVVGMVMRWAK